MRVIPEKYLREIKVGSQQEISETTTRKNLEKHRIEIFQAKFRQKHREKYQAKLQKKPDENLRNIEGLTVLLRIVGSDTEKTFGRNPERNSCKKTVKYSCKNPEKNLSRNPSNNACRNSGRNHSKIFGRNPIPNLGHSRHPSFPYPLKDFCRTICKDRRLWSDITRITNGLYQWPPIRNIFEKILKFP